MRRLGNLNNIAWIRGKTEELCDLFLLLWQGRFEFQMNSEHY